MISLRYLLVTVIALHGTHAASVDDTWDLFQTNDDYRNLLMLYYNELAEELISPPTDQSNFMDTDPVAPATLVSPRVKLPVYNTRALPKWIKQRRPEIEDQVVPTGYQFMSGGAGEGKQHLKPEGTITNKQEVKSDEGLPSYCSPPNPCPFGKTGADGCEENIPDTADFNLNYIYRQMQAGYCDCDQEHMSPSGCPKPEGDERPVDLDEFLEDILQKQHMQSDNQEDNPYSSLVGEKRMSLTAKKGYQHVLIKRSADADEMDTKEKNPYLQGDHLPVVAKKSPELN